MSVGAGICDNPAIVPQALNRLLESVRREPPLRYAISNRTLFPGRDRAEYIVSLFRTPADIVQLREKDLDREALRPLVRVGVDAAREAGSLLLVNSEYELAIEERADGVHLPGHASVRDALEARKRGRPDRFVIGKSVHGIGEAILACREGVDYLLLGPVFPPISKASDMAPIGLSGLREAVGKVSVPIFALGGIDGSNENQVLETGVIGIAGISWVRGYLK